MVKKKNEFDTPQKAFQRMWTIGEGENPRFRGRLACSSAEKMLESYFKVMSDDELFEIQAELDVSTAYYAYYFCMKNKRRLRLNCPNDSKETIDDKICPL